MVIYLFLRLHNSLSLVISIMLTNIHQVSSRDNVKSLWWFLAGTIRLDGFETGTEMGMELGYCVGDHILDGVSRVVLCLSVMITNVSCLF